MTTRWGFPCAVSVAMMLLAGSAMAQTSGADEAATDPPATAVSPIEYGNSTNTSGNSRDSQAEYAPSLDGTGLIALDSPRSTHLLLGATTSAGWDSNPGDAQSSRSSAVYTVSPYFGLQSSTAATQLIVQYQPTITRYVSGDYGAQTMHAVSARMVNHFSERWSLDGKISGRHGQDSIRALAPQQTVSVGGVPGTGAASASYLPNAGTVTAFDGALNLHYKKSERDGVDIGVADSYSRFTSLVGSDSVTTVNLGYDRGLSPTLGVSGYTQGSYYYGTIKCVSVGGGIGVRWRPREGMLLAAGGGPQLDSSDCGSQQGMAYSVAFSTKLTGRSQMYVLTGRQPTASYLGGGLWQTGVSGGYQRLLTPRGTISFDFSRVQSDTLRSVSSYRGTFWDSVYSHKLGHGLNASVSYRGYLSNWGGTNIPRNIVLFSLAWSPDAGHIFQ